MPDYSLEAKIAKALRHLWVVDSTTKEVRNPDSLSEWLHSREEMPPVGRDIIRDGTVTVGTVFLGLDPLEFRPFETMIVGGNQDGYRVTYQTFEQARTGHAKAIRLIERNQPILGGYFDMDYLRSAKE